ncbi:MAG: hypothetical protein ABIG39_06725 [Candidatus Micrarchaeota archaeon]
MKTEKQEKLQKEKCDICGATHPWHFNDCRKIPGGEELYLRNLEEKHNWEKEEWVPREKGAKILEAIMYMTKAPTKEVMLQRKVAIQEEISKL